jgi:hypothetical protein
MNHPKESTVSIRLAAIAAVALVVLLFAAGVANAQPRSRYQLRLGQATQLLGLHADVKR